MKRLFSYLKPLRGFLTLTIFIKIIGTVMDLVIPWILGTILDEIVPQCTADDLSPVFLWGGLMLLCSLIAFVGSTVANRFSSKAAKIVVGKMRIDAFSKILTLSRHQADTFTVPSLVARMSSDTYSIHNMIVQLLRGGMRSPILLIGGVIITFCIEPVLSLSLIVILPFLIAIVFYVSRKGFWLYRAKQERVDDMVRVVRDNFSGIRVIKALSKTEYEKEHFEEVNVVLSKSEQKAGKTMAITKPIMSFFLNLGMIAVIVLGAWRVYTGKTMPGQIVAFMSYITIILNSALGITRIFTIASKGSASASRIAEILDTECDLALLDIPKEESEFYIEFRDVTFSYNKTRPVLSHISFALKKGETLGIIGGTGSGKSTVMALLLRFYDADSGKILIEGRDIRSIPFEELYSRFGTSFQNDFLMADTIAENIRFAREINGEEIRKATVAAQASEFIDSLDEGEDHLLLSHGANVSGGQRQRILIARALAGTPDILILDDSSSALDYKTDAKLRRALAEKERGNTTTVIIAQRTSSIRNSDHILVLEHGNPIGYGTHEELMNHCAVYQEIAKSQMGELNA